MNLILFKIQIPLTPYTPRIKYFIPFSYFNPISYDGKNTISKRQFYGNPRFMNCKIATLCLLKSKITNFLPILYNYSRWLCYYETRVHRPLALSLLQYRHTQTPNKL